MRIAEIFCSRQGEGRLTGLPSVFVRASGCNLRCEYCDTPYASSTPEGDELSTDEILARVEQLGRAGAHALPPLPGAGLPPPEIQREAATCQAVSAGRTGHVVLTGGEPMLFADLVPLTAGLRAAGWHITIETAGTLYLPVACDLMSISPKLSRSTPTADRQWAKRHAERRHAPEVIRRLVREFDYQMKFVIGEREDCLEAQAYLAQFPEIDRGRVMLMPQGVCADELAQITEWLAPYCARNGLRFCPRRQIEWFGPGRGK